MATVTINGQEYDTDQLSEETKKQLGSVQFVDKRINELRAELAALQTARNAYGNALNELLSKEEG